MDTTQVRARKVVKEANTVLEDLAKRPVGVQTMETTVLVTVQVILLIAIGCLIMNLTKWGSTIIGAVDLFK